MNEFAPPAAIVRPARGCFFSGVIDTPRQLPTPSGAAWLFDLGDIRGPWILVLRDNEDEARHRLAEHLVELGQADTVVEALSMLTGVLVDHAGVIW